MAVTLVYHMKYMYKMESNQGSKNILICIFIGVKNVSSNKLNQ